MRPSQFKFRSIYPGAVLLLTALATIFIFALPTAASPRIAILSEPGIEHFEEFNAAIAKELSADNEVFDRDLVESAFSSLKITDRFNMSIYEARAAARVIGCDVMILIDNKKWRRIKLEADDYFERSAGIFIVDGRSGILKAFHHFQQERTSEQAAEQATLSAIPEYIKKISPDISTPARSLKLSEFPIVPDTEPDKTFRPPMPYKRISPTYTQLAYMQDIKATVDIEVSVSRDGTLAQIDIIRWAGYGLDESVERAIRQMNWRPATRGKETLPMKVLLRYNFKKIDKSE